MHIQIVHQYFRTPETGGGLRTYYIAKELIKAGHRVTVITATNNQRGNSIVLEGIDIHSVPVYYSNHLSFYSRIHAFLRYVFSAIAIMKKLARPDINYIVTTPLTTGLIGIFGKWRFNIPYIFEVGDLWPEAPIQLRILKNPFLKYLARKFEALCYKQASALVGLSPPISDYLKAERPEKEVLTVTNFSNPEYFESDQISDRHTLGFSDEDFVISYIGTIGLANALDKMIDAINSLPAEWKVKGIIMGSGAQEESVKEYAAGKENNAVTFLPHGSLEAVKGILDISDCTYISYASVPVLETGSPNKFFDSLAAGKLIVLNFGGWLKDIIESHEIGFSYSSEEELKDKLEPYVRSRNLLSEVSVRAKKLATENFTPEVQIKKLLELLERTTQ